jgi:hypothetical protein
MILPGLLGVHLPLARFNIIPKGLHFSTDCFYHCRIFHLWCRNHIQVEAVECNTTIDAKALFFGG